MMNTPSYFIGDLISALIVATALAYSSTVNRVLSCRFVLCLYMFDEAWRLPQLTTSSYHMQCRAKYQHFIHQLDTHITTSLLRHGMSGRKDFLSQPAPENYVAGLGRGATGFTTRSDLGPAREGPSEEQIKEALAKRAAQLGNAPPTAYGVSGKKDDDDDDEERFQDPDNETGLFASGNYDREDDEADRIYDEVDAKMDRRRRMRRLVLPIPLPPSLPFV